MDFILKNSEIDHNGSYRFTSLDNSLGKDTSSSAGVKARLHLQDPTGDNMKLNACNRLRRPITDMDNKKVV